MALKLVFIGRLEDVAGSAERSVPLARSWDALMASLEPDLAAALRGPRVRVACNGEVTSAPQDLVLADDDEIAFLPPVSGG